jgi:hypothetical protein
MRRVLDAPASAFADYPCASVVSAGWIERRSLRRAAIENGRLWFFRTALARNLLDALARRMPASTTLLLANQLQLLADKEWAMYKPRWDAFQHAARIAPAEPRRQHDRGGWL